MTSFSRADTSILGRWWWTLDRWALLVLTLLFAVGAILTVAASPGAASRIGLEPFYFVRHQFAFMAPALLIMLAVSMLSPRGVRRMAVLILAVGLVCVAATHFAGVEAKGASRWLSLGDFTFQPSEFVKPCFAVVAAWMFAEYRQSENFPGRAIAGALLLITVALLLLQPDFGMAVTVTAVWFVQFFLAGLSLWWVGLSLALTLGLVTAAYGIFPHVAKRIDLFIDPSSGDSYQVTTSLKAFQQGGLLGKGPGEGVVKGYLPDAHTDFIFAVAAEEFGMLAALAIVGLFSFVVLRGLARVVREANLFVLLAVAGLLTQFGLQALINMGVTVQLLPAKGMTLPFVSYGGSSLIASALGMGMMLALTRSGYRNTVSAP
ncbi:MAG: putative peptidoglycan glycosyltransferase FtsW [Alphaproteobacteria bacterium]|nr:putative peptidoglycan glycosyltransferase FtsW [Alphaproteobacteria bacterium]